MIIERTFYAIQCDSCKIKAKNYEGHAFWQDKSISREFAIASEWHEERDKHYCPECYSFDEEPEAPMMGNAVPQELIKRSIGISRCITEAVKNRLPTWIIRMYVEESERISKEFNRYYS